MSRRSGGLWAEKGRGKGLIPRVGTLSFPCCRDFPFIVFFSNYFNLVPSDASW